MKFNNAVTFLSGIIFIFGFLTGIQNLPQLLNITSIENGIFNSDLGNGTSVSIFIISQSLYYLSFFLILKFIRYKLFSKDKNFTFFEGGDSVFWLFLFTIISLGLSLLYYEIYWGPIDSFTNPTNAQAGFTVYSIVISIFIVWNAFEFEGD